MSATRLTAEFDLDQRAVRLVGLGASWRDELTAWLAANELDPGLVRRATRDGDRVVLDVSELFPPDVDTDRSVQALAGELPHTALELHSVPLRRRGEDCVVHLLGEVHLGTREESRLALQLARQVDAVGFEAANLPSSSSQVLRTVYGVLSLFFLLLGRRLSWGPIHTVRRFGKLQDLQRALGLDPEPPELFWLEEGQEAGVRAKLLPWLLAALVLWEAANLAQLAWQDLRAAITAFTFLALAIPGAAWVLTRARRTRGVLGGLFANAAGIGSSRERVMTERILEQLDRPGITSVLVCVGAAHVAPLRRRLLEEDEPVLAVVHPAVS